MNTIAPQAMALDARNWSVSGFARRYALALVFVAASDTPETSGYAFIAAMILVYGGLAATLMLPQHRAVEALLMLGIAGQAIVDLDPDTSHYASIWLNGYGIFTPSWIVSFFLVAQVVKARRLVLDSQVKSAIAWFATVPVATGLIYGGFGTELGLRPVISDLRLSATLLASILAFGSAIRAVPTTLSRLMMTFTATVLARHSVDFAFAFLETGVNFGIGNIVSVDPAKALVVYLLILSVLMSAYFHQPLRSLLLGAGSTFLIVAYSARIIYITSATSLALLAPVVGLKRLLQSAAVFGLVSLTGIYLLAVFRPDTALGALMRGETLLGGRTFLELDVDDNFVSRIDPARYAEILNAGRTSWERCSLLWGNGYGSYYTDKVIPFPEDLLSAFSADELEQGKFFSTHDYLTHMLFKHGMVGLVLMTSLWLRPARAALRALRSSARQAQQDDRVLELCIAALIPFCFTGILTLYWSGKGLLVSGFIIAALREYGAQRATQAASRRVLQSALSTPLRGTSAWGGIA